MLFPVYAALAIAALFYLGIPLVGAFTIRAQWRHFRSRLAELALAPNLGYADVAAALGSGGSAIGRFRLYGRVEALEGPNRIWLRGKGVSALVDFTRAPLYFLASGEGAANTVTRLPWTSVSSLTEGTPLFAAGLVVLDSGNPVFVDAPGESLIAATYDCEDRELAPALVEGGRAWNEYWTPITRVSIALGIALTSVLMAIYSPRMTFSTLRAMTFFAGVLPLLPLVPPGLPFFLLYRSLWRRAWSLRAMRDAFRMPLAHFPEGLGGPTSVELPDGGRYVARSIPENGEIPPGAIVLDAIRDSGRWGGSWLFSAEGSDDPAAATVVTRGDPAKLGESAARQSAVFTLLAGASLGLGVALNYVIGVLLWQRLF